MTSFVTKAEYRWVVIFSGMVMLIATLPYLIGYANQGENWQFTGFVFNVEDGNSYIAKMLRGSAGEWLFKTPYTAMPQRGVMIFLPYLLLGKLAAPPGVHEQLLGLFHLFRIAAGILAILATYNFLALFLRDVRLRQIGLVLVTLGGGLGWVLVMIGRTNWLGSLPLDFYSPETFGFLALYGIPHLALARAFLLWGLAAYLDKTVIMPDTLPSFKDGAKIGVIWLLASLAQPLAGLVILAVVGSHLFALAGWQAWRGWRSEPTDWLRWRRMACIAIWAGLVPVPLLLYTFVSFLFDPFLKAWTAQNTIPSPHPFHYLLAFGVLLPFTLIGISYLLKRNPWLGSMPAVWVLSLPALAYAPFNLQRRLPEGIWVALVTLGMLPFDRLKVRTFKRSIILVSVIMVSIGSTLFLLMGGIKAAARPGWPLSRPSDEVAMFVYLAQQAEPDAVVLTAFETGNALPAWSPQRVVIGHGPESANFKETQRRLSEFFEPGTSDAARIALLEEASVEYILWGPAERDLGGWDPGKASYLLRVFKQGEYSLFEVTP
ncbi:MAG TPA: hypothetical protein VI755_09795 [Anaerolineales bacterium]|nr:hypothetical protein [Anaerolineales bacterium]